MTPHSLLVRFFLISIVIIKCKGNGHKQSRIKLHLDSQPNNKEKSIVQLMLDSPAFLSEDLEIECKYTLDNHKLYSIKWYKDNEEFFQYMPSENPSVQFFKNKRTTFQSPFYEISNETFRLWLKNVSLNHRGVYGCELSIDSPEFMIFKDYKQLEVYVLPDKSPRITGSRAHFGIKNRIDLNCTSPKSKPVSSLQWYINDLPAPNDYLIQYPPVNHSEGLLTKTLRLKFTVSEEHFHSGDMRLECVAVYRRMASDWSNGTIIRHRSRMRAATKQSSSTHQHNHHGDHVSAASAVPGSNQSSGKWLHCIVLVIGLVHMLMPT